MARIAILGATGKLGQQLVNQALRQGFGVNALARNPRRITRQNEQLTVIQGDAETGEGLDALLDGCQFAISALGSLRPAIEKCMRQLVPRVEAHRGFRRLLVISRLGTSGSLEQSSKVSGLVQSRLPTLLLPIFRDINAAEAVVRNSAVSYSILRSTRLVDGKATGRVIAVDANRLPPHRVSRADLAQFAIEVLEQSQWHRKESTVGAE